MAKDLAKQDDFDFDFGIDMSSMMMMIMMVVMVSVVSSLTTTTAQAAQTAQTVQALSYEGRSDPRTVPVSERLGLLDLINNPPHTPWIGAYFINDGPGAVRVGINSPAVTFTMNAGETITIDRSGAQERISALFFICDVGLTATLRIIGEY